jgi:predicted Fe-Mo cluster-binding NifX family protein
MKIAFTAKGTGWDSPMDPRLGRTEYILLYDEEKDELSVTDNREIEGVAHGAGTKTAQLLYDVNPDILVTGNGPGNNAALALKQGSMKIFVGAGDMTVKAAYEAYKRHELKEF